MAYLSSNRRGFTLIELLVAIAIIGVLASIILTSLQGARDKAKKAKAREELIQIVRAVQLGQIVLQQPMGVITGNYCTSCSATDAADVASLQNISTKTGIPNLDKLRTDPWGGRYTFDENELEFNSTDCRRDLVFASNGDASVQYAMPYSSAYCKANPSGTEGWQADF